MHRLKKALKIIQLLGALLLILMLLTQSVWQAQDVGDRVRRYTRPYEFDYFFWTLRAIWEKGGQAALGTVKWLSVSQQREIVFEFIKLSEEVRTISALIEQVYANPGVENPAAETASLLDGLEELENRLDWLAPLAESVVQYQIQVALTNEGMDIAGMVFPLVLFRVSEVPDQLIISPREVIRQETGVSLAAGLTAVEVDELENRVSTDLNVSALVVPLGGVGVYPTMVYRDADLQYLIKIVAHEWMHNYLTLHPLGLRYDTSPQLRSMNETTADICGTEISALVMRRFYADRLPPTESLIGQTYEISLKSQPHIQEVFDFRKEMHATRVRVDELLGQGRVAEAETYMETRRKFFWENGYQIRKLNQAYFAFYGAYAEQPLGAAGNDPVGPAVRALRSQSASLADFVRRIAWMTSFEQLQESINIY